MSRCVWPTNVSLLLFSFLSVVVARVLPTGTKHQCGGSDELLLVVGDVGRAHARILFEPCALDAVDLPVVVRLAVDLSPVVALTVSVPVETAVARHPRVLQLQDLTPHTAYNVSLGKHSVGFTTLPDPTSTTATTPLKLVFVSCDRWAEDGDNSFFKVRPDARQRQIFRRVRVDGSTSVFFISVDSPCVKRMSAWASSCFLPCCPVMSYHVMDGPLSFLHFCAVGGPGAGHVEK